MSNQNSIKEGSKNYWNSLPWWVKLIVIIVIVSIAFLIIYNLYKNYKKDKQQKQLEESTKDTVINGQTVSVNLGTKASAIYNAFYENDVFGWSEDEDAAVRELTDVPKPLIQSLSDIYYKVYGKNLKNDFQKYASDEWPKISYLFA